MMQAERVAPGLWKLGTQLDWGWSVGMLLGELPGGGVLVHSPTWCGDGTFEAIDALGEVRAIVAPNHYHHLSLARFRARYPSARAVIAADARPRLEQKGHAGLGDLSELGGMLPPGARAIACAHTKSGEAWLVWPGDGGATLVACDSFFHVTQPVRGFRGWMLRRMKIAPGLCFGWTYKHLCVRDRPAYREWAEATIREIAPRRLAVSHGDTLEDAALADRLCALLDERCV